MNQKIPDYLYEKGNIIRLILFTAFFALAFINLYKPFGSDAWFRVSEATYFLGSSLIMLTGVFVVVISRIIMYHHCKKKDLMLLGYCIWVLAEILAMATFYTLFEKMVLHDVRSIEVMIKQSFINTSLVLLLPYSMSWLFFSWKDKNKKLEKIAMEENSSDLTKRGMLSFYDEKGEFKLSVQSDQLLYLESADNYVKIYYLNKGKLSNFMLRNSLKMLDESFSNTAMIRCHRSFIVNFDRVKVLRKEKDGIYLALDQENAPDIPVSKTFTERVMTKFAHYSI
ncbi:MAG: LytTR family DNA-binding domain-containing protein [Bacteroidales bacterium]|nr:LytTR family DNA-binding domain-containing protein [Bacteroidales bacterium]